MLIEKAARREQHARTAAFEHVCRLVAAHARVDRHQCGADAVDCQARDAPFDMVRRPDRDPIRSEEHTSELQSLMRNSYSVFCLTKKITTTLNINAKHS